MFAHLSLSLFSRLQAWKLWLQSRIKIVTRLFWSLLPLCSLRFQFIYRYTVDKTPRFLVIWHFYLLIWLRFTKIVMIFFLLSLWCIGDWIYLFFDWFTWHLGFMKTHLCCGKTLGINRFIQHIAHITKPLVLFRFIALVLKLW